MRGRGWFLFTVKWFAILWASISILVVLVSNIMIISRLPSLLGILPFNAQDHLRVAFLLAPALVACIIWSILERKERNRLDRTRT